MLRRTVLLLGPFTQSEPLYLSACAIAPKHVLWAKSPKSIGFMDQGRSRTEGP